MIVWKQVGVVSLWRYTENERNYPGWHLNSDSTGCESLLALVDELDRNPGSHRTVQLVSPSQAQLAVPNNKNGRAAWLAPAKLKLTRSTENEAWSFPPDHNPASLTFGSRWMENLREGIAGISKGRGDFSIGNAGPGSLPLWFWWSGAA